MPSPQPARQARLLLLGACLAVLLAATSLPGASAESPPDTTTPELPDPCATVLCTAGHVCVPRKPCVADEICAECVENKCDDPRLAYVATTDSCEPCVPYFHCTTAICDSAARYRDFTLNVAPLIKCASLPDSELPALACEPNGLGQCAFKVIPHGCTSWYDGCNSCRVKDNGKLGACTDRACDKLEAPRCLTFNIPPRCTSWFDGCNTCNVEDGTIGACTRRACQEFEPTRCLAYSVPSSCTSWFDGCNTCRADNGELGPCTLIACDEYKPGRCLTYDIPKACTLWFDGCNTCRVKDGELKGCTELACLRHEEPECLAVDAPEGCIEWFDGCNTCRVKDGKLKGCTELACKKLERPECRRYESPCSEKGICKEGKVCVPRDPCLTPDCYKCVDTKCDSALEAYVKRTDQCQPCVPHFRCAEAVCTTAPEYRDWTVNIAPRVLCVAIGSDLPDVPCAMSASGKCKFQAASRRRRRRRRRRTRTRTRRRRRRRTEAKP